MSKSDSITDDNTEKVTKSKKTEKFFKSSKSEIKLKSSDINSGKINMGGFLSTSREIRKIPGYKYLVVGFKKHCETEKVEYWSTAENWLKLFNEFRKKS